jgi:hypothetical protein
VGVACQQHLSVTLWHGDSLAGTLAAGRRFDGYAPAVMSGAPSLSADGVEEPGREAWLAVGVTTLVFFLVVIDVSAVNVVFPSIRDDFEVSEATLGWVISGYNITVAALLMVAGRYADSIGRKKLFLPGVGIFMLGSLLSGLAPDATLLIAARVVQGIGGAIIARLSCPPSPLTSGQR